jgi:fatty acid desaturase
MNRMRKNRVFMRPLALYVGTGGDFGMSEQVSDRQARWSIGRFELPTTGVVLAVYGGFFAWSWWFRDLSPWLAVPLGAILLTWHGSLQHETIHQHPTPWRWVNSFIGSIPLSLWLPYSLYRRSHLRHHRFGGRHLTDPMRDPESFYLEPGQLESLGGFGRFIATANCTFGGRMILGPALALATFFAGERKALATFSRQRMWIWFRHGIGVGAVLFWVCGVCKIPGAVYLGLVIYPSMSLQLMRSFAEHRANPDPTLRTAVVEANPLWSLLFLNNNFHIVHHDRPAVPWYELPRLWRQTSAADRDRSAAAGMVFRGGYLDIVKSFLLRPVIAVEHPAGRDE